MEVINGTPDTIAAIPKQQFITGSTLVRGIKPNDKDVVCLFDTWKDLESFTKGKLVKTDEPVSLDSEMRFFSVYEGNTNYICTDDVELFYRFKAFSGALSMLQLKHRDDRIELSRKCLYWEGE